MIGMAEPQTMDRTNPLPPHPVLLLSPKRKKKKPPHNNQAFPCNDQPLTGHLQKKKTWWLNPARAPVHNAQKTKKGSMLPSRTLLIDDPPSLPPARATQHPHKLTRASWYKRGKRKERKKRRRRGKSIRKRKTTIRHGKSLKHWPASLKEHWSASRPFQIPQITFVWMGEDADRKCGPRRSKIKPHYRFWWLTWWCKVL